MHHNDKRNLLPQLTHRFYKKHKTLITTKISEIAPEQGSQVDAFVSPADVNQRTFFIGYE
jgi:hypothetical protein